MLIAALAAMLLQGCRAARVRTAANAPAPAPDTVFSITLIGDDCKFADHVDYGIYVPGGNRTIRGVMVFQHGCSQEEFGISRHCDVQYQALARKWDLAIVEPTIFGLCDIWAFPENGSYKSLLLALSKAGARTGHPELATAPFLLWGHSGGGLWTLAMLNQHPERIIAAVCYSAAWDPDWDYPEVAYDVPVIFLTALGQENDIIEGYEIGADEYLTKPYSTRLLLMKVNALIKRYRGLLVKDGRIDLDEITIEPARRQVSVNGRRIELTPREYELLLYFVENRDQALTRNQILDAVWGRDYEGYDRAVDTYIKKLRASLGEASYHIETVIKLGYMWKNGR